MRNPLLVDLQHKLQRLKGLYGGETSQWADTVVQPRGTEGEADTDADSGHDTDYLTGFDSQFLDDLKPPVSESVSSTASSTAPRAEAAAPAARPPAEKRSAVADTAPAPTEAEVRASTTLSTIGRYAIKGHLGAGGLGQVYEAWDPVLSRSVAVKTVQLNLEPDVRAMLDEHILNEARAAAGLSHPHIVTVFDAGLSPQGVYIAMERLVGRDIREALARGWRPRPSQTAQIMRRVAEALAYAHAKGVVHCDIKPANIFLDRLDRPKVLDFGIARVAHRRRPNGNDPLIGSPHYLAPEQLLNGVADARTDIRAMGVVLYELLTLSRAFGGDSVDQVTEAVLLNQPKPAMELRRNIPRTLVAIATKAMATEPSQRYQTASEMANALRLWSARHAARKERVAARTRTRKTNESVLRGLISPTQIMVAAAVTLAGVVLLWNLLPSVNSNAEQVAAKDDKKPAGPEDDILFARLARAGTGAPEVPASEPAALPTVPDKPAADVGPASDVVKAPAGDGSRTLGRTPATPDSGTVMLDVTPWAQVEVNGVMVGLSPPMAQLLLPEGEHAITLRSTGFVPYTVTVMVRETAPVELRHRFTR